MTLEDGLINVIHELYNEQKPKEVIRGGVYKQNKNKLKYKDIFIIIIYNY